MRPDSYPPWKADTYFYELIGEFIDSDGITQTVSTTMTVASQALEDVGVVTLRWEAECQLEDYVFRRTGHRYAVKPVKSFWRDERIAGDLHRIPVD